MLHMHVQLFLALFCASPLAMLPLRSPVNEPTIELASHQLQLWLVLCQVSFDTYVCCTSSGRQHMNLIASNEGQHGNAIGTGYV